VEARAGFSANLSVFYSREQRSPADFVDSSRSNFNFLLVTMRLAETIKKQNQAKFILMSGVNNEVTKIKKKQPEFRMLLLNFR
jgi:hypothetical protein